MATLLQQSRNLRRLNPARLEEDLFRIIRKQESKLVKLNQNQLSKGEDTEGNLFGTYSELTEQLALFDNPRKSKVSGEPYNFEYTGETFDTMFADAPGKEVFFGTNGELQLEFQEKYPKAFGLNDQNLKSFVKEELLPLFLRGIRQKLKI